ncbi:unnamed protein product [Bemisia tabaci]|uniref:Uncharacterized protein n=1 Tax=Bemisia tabaci TaxID=7038 RepID=A0A9P0A1Z0_BEMTA|nr:unnamed protein product [Bemisia tabaci]
MTLKLDDFLTKKKEPAQILDLSKATANSKEELRRLIEKIPEYKIKPEKVKPDEIKIREKDFSFKITKKELKPKREYGFQDPTPPEMREIKLEDLSSVNIPWKMLTSLRPKTKLDEEFYSRLVELGKLALKTRAREKRIQDSDFVRKMKNRAGIVETRILSCKECYEEFCTGEACCDFLYESYQRENRGPVAVDESGQPVEKQDGRARGRAKKKRRLKKKPKPRAKSTKSLDRGKTKLKRDSPQRRSKSLDKQRFLKDSHDSSQEARGKSESKRKSNASKSKKAKSPGERQKKASKTFKKKVTMNIGSGKGV